MRNKPITKRQIYDSTHIGSNLRSQNIETEGRMVVEVRAEVLELLA